MSKVKMIFIGGGAGRRPFVGEGTNSVYQFSGNPHGDHHIVEVEHEDVDSILSKRYKNLPQIVRYQSEEDGGLGVTSSLFPGSATYFIDPRDAVLLRDARTPKGVKLYDVQEVAEEYEEVEVTLTPSVDLLSQFDITPKAAEHAQLLGIDLTSINGSGKNGRITLSDVKAVADFEEETIEV